MVFGTHRSLSWNITGSWKNHLEEERPLYKYLFRLFLFIYFDDCHNIFVLSLVYPEYVALLRVKNKV